MRVSAHGITWAPPDTEEEQLMDSPQANVSPTMRDLSEYIAQAVGQPLPPEVLETTKIHLVDTVAAMISGSQLPPGQRAIEYTRREGGSPDASLMVSDIVTSAGAAALANGIFAHADETDDVHTSTTTHPGAAVVPAALAMGERNGLSGHDVLRAIALGYDVCGRHGRAMDLREMHRSGIAINNHSQTFGAAAAAGALMGLAPRDVRFVLSYAAEQASGVPPFTRDTEHIQKAFGSGRAAQNGVAAALMVGSRFTGMEDVFSDSSNYFEVYAPKADLAHLTAGLGTDFEISQTSIKNWPTGGPTQAPLWLLQELIQRHGITADQVDRVVVRMAPLDVGIVDNSMMPNIGVQHLVALILVDGTVSFDSAHDYSRISDPRVLELRQRIEIVKTERMADAVRRWRAEVDLTLLDGRQFSEEVLAVKGSVQNPMDREGESAKAHALFTPVIGADRSEELLDALWDFELLEDVRELRPRLGNDARS
jgi:2-methylcitrate dehydratase PrpD